MNLHRGINASSHPLTVEYRVFERISKFLYLVLGSYAQRPLSALSRFESGWTIEWDVSCGTSLDICVHPWDSQTSSTSNNGTHSDHIE